MSAKKKVAAASQDGSPEQIVEDVGADESRPQGEGAADVKASDQASVEDASHSTSEGGDGEVGPQRGSAAWATRSRATILKEATAEVLCQTADGTDHETIIRAVLAASNEAVEEANRWRGGTFKRLPFHKELTPGQLRQIEKHLGEALDPALVVQTTAQPMAADVDPVERDAAAFEKQQPQRRGGGQQPGVKPEEVVRELLASHDLFMGHDGSAYAVPSEPNELRVARRLSAMGGPMRRRFWRHYGETLSSEALNNALATVEALAVDSPLKRVKLRASIEADRVVVDLGRPDGKLAVITAAGWDLVGFDSEEPIPDTIWVRSGVSHPLPVPVRGGHRDMLGDVQGLAPDDPIRMVQWGWAVASYLMVDEPCPILWWVGPQGSGKTSKGKNVLDLVDPSPKMSTPPKDPKDDNVRAASRYVVTADNIGTKVTESVSDWMCRLVTGFMDEKRALYTDGDLHVSEIKRTMIATSLVKPMGLGNDVLQRTLFVEVPAIPEGERLTEAELKRRYAEAAPLILGALFDDVAGVLAKRDEVAELRSKGKITYHRMADYSAALHALDLHHGMLGDESGFERTFRALMKDTMQEAAGADPFVTAVKTLVPNPGDEWIGTASELLARLTKLRPTDQEAAWPKTATGAGKLLVRHTETLRAVGVEMTSERTGGSRTTTLRNVTQFAAAVPDGNDPHQVALWQDACEHADGLTAHLIAVNKGELAGSLATVIDNGSGSYYIASGGSEADAALWDAAAGTYNGQLQRTWMDIPSRFRDRPAALPYP